MKTTIRWFPNYYMKAEVFETFEDSGENSGLTRVKNQVSQILDFMKHKEVKESGNFKRPVFMSNCSEYIKGRERVLEEQYQDARVLIGLPKKWTKKAILDDLKRLSKAA
jgi:hypothetical protein